jgi:HTH-type transcriptional regulator / antitoxin HipB
MPDSPKSSPIGNQLEDIVVRSAADIGRVARQRRAELALGQLELAGLANTGNRFIVELERGKPTLQLQKTLDLLSLLGLEVVLRRKTSARL